jgi:hyaluronan synthase
MNLESPKYPIIKPDRRIRARARRDYKERRDTIRYRSSFPVKIYIGNGKKSEVYDAIAYDISDGGMLISGINIPENEDRINIKFRIPDGTMPEQYSQGVFKLKGKVRRKGGEAIGLEFEEKLSTSLSKSVWQWLKIIALLTIIFTVGLFFAVKSQNVYWFWFNVPIFVYSLAVGSYLLSRYLFALFYKPPKPREDELPTVTVIIPAYNEEEEIMRTIRQIMESEYPSDKLSVIAINDGSADNTLKMLLKAKEIYPDLIVIDFGENRGKREAMATGVRMAKSEIVVFVDSDSFLYPDAIRNIVDGFADEKVAGVCGHCDVENIWTNALTKMQAVRYYISFIIMKAAESVFDSVTCLSGPLAAYKKSIVMEVLDDWEHQTAFGNQATFGDDRSLTTFLLKKYKVIYDSRAITTTIVPEKYKQFLKQQARWKRSWFRESMRASLFMWKKQPLMALSFYLGFLLPLLGPFVVVRAMLWVPIIGHGTPFTYLFGIILMSALMSSAYLFLRKSKLWVYSFTFNFFYMFVLIWQLPWAVLTFWTSGWGTRNKKKKLESF